MDASPLSTDRQHLHAEAEWRWRKLGQDHPDLAETIAFGRGLVKLYINELPAAGVIALTPEAAREKLAAGVPLLEEEDVQFDLPGIQRFFYRLCSWAGGQPDLAAGGDRLQRALITEDLRVEDLLDAALNGDEDQLNGVAERFAVPLEMVQTLVGFTVSAALLETGRALEPLLAAAGAAWSQPTCPVCGGPPLLAELVGSGETRLLRCAACGVGWHAEPDRCVHCGFADDGTLHTLPEGHPDAANRLELCDHCHGYLKIAAVAAPTPAELLTIVDTAFLPLDAIARERGYAP
jgi:FdhE protein